MSGRSRRRATAVIALGLAVVLAGCSGGRARSGGKSAPSPTSPVSARHSGIPASAFAGQKPYTGPAVDEYGQAGLKSAYVEMVNFTFETGWNSNLIRKDRAHLAMADFANLRSYLTAACRKAFDANLAQALQSEATATKKLEEVAFFDVASRNGMAPVSTGSVVTARKFTEASVGIDRLNDQPRLTMAFAAKATIELVDATTGKHYTMPTSRVLRYLLVANTGPTRTTRPFLVESWAITATLSRPATAS